MNKKNFELFMNSVDDKLLEEAMQPHNFTKRHYLRYASLAACFLFLVFALIFYRPLNVSKDTITIEEIQALGYELPLPSSAEDIIYTVSSVETEDRIASVNASFINDREKYILAAQKDNVSNIPSKPTTEPPLTWYADGLEVQMCSTSDNGNWFSWYIPQTSTRYTLSTESDALYLLQTANEIMEQLGYQMAIAPEGATDIIYQAFLYKTLTVAETSFQYNDIRYCFRTAATYEINDFFTDISGEDFTYQTEEITELGWCPARIYYNENSTGKIVWFDIAPGLLYSLTMDSGASKNTLISMAEALYSPAQGDN